MSASAASPSAPYSAWSLPRLSWRFVPVWRRNFLVWRKLFVERLLTNVVEPLLTIAAFGYGLGSLLPEIDGVSYLQFLASGSIAMSVMYSAKFESLWGAFSRMQIQKTWDAILNAPLTLDDVLLGEMVWGASKSFLSGVAVLLVATVLGLVASPLALFVLPVIFLTGLAFAGLGLIMTALSPNYDFFMYYFTLVITPMAMLCGVFYPVSQLPQWFQQVAAVLPLTHAVELVRPLLLGNMPDNIVLHLAVLAGYGAVSFFIAVALMRRRLLS